MGANPEAIQRSAPSRPGTTRRMTPLELRTAIAAAGLSQVAAAKAIGLNPRTIRRMLKGDWAISQRVQAWAKNQHSDGLEGMMS